MPCAGVRPVFYDADLDTVFWVFPNDRKLPGLAAVADGELSRREGLPRAWQSTRLMAYAPEKSATLACLDDSGTVVAYAKVSAHDQVAHDYHTYRALSESAAGNPHLRLPRPLAYLSQYHLLLIEAIDGRRMDDPAGARRGAGRRRIRRGARRVPCARATRRSPIHTVCCRPADARRGVSSPAFVPMSRTRPMRSSAS